MKENALDSSSSIRLLFVKKKFKMPTKCLIEFENCPSKVIYSGQLLLGRVHLTLTQTKKVHGIFVRIKGKAFAHWDDGPDSTTYVGDQVYLDKQIYLIGGKNGNKFITFSKVLILVPY